MLGETTSNNADQRQSQVELFRNLFSTHALALGVAKDTIINLLYRIRNSKRELPQHPPKVWWILIGINDLEYTSLCSREATLAGTLAVVQELQQRSDNDNDNDSIIVLNSILPTSRMRNGSMKGKPVWEHRISWVNHRLECYATLTKGVEFFNATDIFLSGDGTRINMTLLPDRVHPSLIGYELWGRRIVEKLAQLSVTISH
jgi:lysophospholipase L1-like esterase